MPIFTASETDAAGWGEKNSLPRLTVTGERIELFLVGESGLRRTTVCRSDGLATVVAL
jgi:hypothetical protein